MDLAQMIDDQPFGDPIAIGPQVVEVRQMPLAQKPHVTLLGEIARRLLEARPGALCRR